MITPPKVFHVAFTLTSAFSVHPCRHQLAKMELSPVKTGTSLWLPSSCAGGARLWGGFHGAYRAFSWGGWYNFETKRGGDGRGWDIGGCQVWYCKCLCIHEWCDISLFFSHVAVATAALFCSTACSGASLGGVARYAERRTQGFIHVMITRVRQRILGFGGRALNFPRPERRTKNISRAIYGTKYERTWMYRDDVLKSYHQGKRLTFPRLTCTPFNNTLHRGLS